MHSVPHGDRLALDGAWRFQLLHRPGRRARRDLGRGRGPGLLDDAGHLATCPTTRTCRCRSPACRRRSRRRTRPASTSASSSLPAGGPGGASSSTSAPRRACSSSRSTAREVGVCKDSHLAAEFDVDAFVRAGANTVSPHGREVVGRDVHRGPGPVVARGHHPVGVPLRHRPVLPRRRPGRRRRWPTTSPRRLASRSASRSVRRPAHRAPGWTVEATARRAAGPWPRRAASRRTRRPRRPRLRDRHRRGSLDRQPDRRGRAHGRGGRRHAGRRLDGPRAGPRRASRAPAGRRARRRRRGRPRCRPLRRSRRPRVRPPARSSSRSSCGSASGASRSRAGPARQRPARPDPRREPPRLRPADRPRRVRREHAGRPRR